MNYIPFVLEKNSESERSYDIFSRLLQDRIIMLTGEINDQMAAIIISSLLYLNSIDQVNKISLYINSPGGSINAGMAIIDTMNFINAPVETICIGEAMSMGAVILASGKRGMRYSLIHSEIMIHQPRGGFEGVASDILIHSKRMEDTKKEITKLLASLMDKKESEVKKLTDRDYFMTSYEAKSLGLIDNVLEKIK